MNKFISYLEKQQKHHLAEAKNLADSGREDESILEKIKANIFNIFIEVSQTPNQTADYMPLMMEKIPKTWYESLGKSKEHGDFEREAQERVKIAIMDEIKAKYAILVRENADEC